jgi:hypothetical protein
MIESKELITCTLNSLNQKYGLDVKIENVNDSVILPKVNKRSMTIRNNNRLLSLFVLYQMGNADLVIKYFVMHKYLSYNMYDEALYWLGRTETKAKKVIEKRQNALGQHLTLIVSIRNLFSRKSHLKDSEILLMQHLFVLLHEYGHVLFYKEKELKNDYFKQVRDILAEFEKSDEKGVMREISKEITWGCRSFLFQEIGYGFINRNIGMIGQIAEDERKIEEFACDLHAWHVLASILHYGGYSLIEQVDAFTNVIESLYYLENYKALDDCLSYKVDMNRAEGIALFDSIRYSILTHTIVMYLESKQKGKGLDFDRKFHIFRWEERKDYVALINKYIAETKNLERGSLLPDKEKLMFINQKISAFEETLIQQFQSTK